MGVRRPHVKRGTPRGWSTLEAMSEQTSPRPGRNEPCYCGSGKKYKQCHLLQDEAANAAARATAAAEVPAEAVEAAATPAVPSRAAKSKTHQPWRATTSRGFVPPSRAPRKMGGGGS